MNLHSERTMLKNALLGNYAIGAFNFSNMTMLRSIVDAANEEKSPVILAVSESAFKIVSPKFLRRLIQAVLEDASVPIALHLDHGKTIEAVQSALDTGFNSIMIDGSSKPFQENIEITSKVVELCRKYDASVEGELGRLAGIEDDVKVKNADAMFTDPQEAQYFVNTTGVDSLAVAIGTSHGAYKFKGEAKLRFDILHEIETRLKGYPIVLHGASSVPQDKIEQITKYGGVMTGAKGVPEELLKQASQTTNVCKINCDTDLRVAFTASVRKTLVEHPEKFSPRDYLQPARDDVKELIKSKMRNVLCSSNKAE